MILSQLVASMFFIGLISFMVGYDAVHYYCHFGPELEIPWLKTLRINHLKHHYRNQKTNFGVTTNLWDKLLGTYDSKTKGK
jgi:sterol desaturase/sphingolipid hydroxylase (fatty acid hydroxylase superfamily)